MGATLPEAKNDVQAPRGKAPARSAGAGSAALPSTRAVTRVESGKAAGQSVKVDWLNATFDHPAMTPLGVVEILGKLCGRPMWSVQSQAGLFGFETRLKLYAYVGGLADEVGSLAYGGEAQRGRWLLQLTGRGCALVEDWEGLRELLEGFQAKLTRVDLALDLLNGEYSVDDAAAMHKRGEFSGNGRPPSTHVAGDWLDQVHGRTLYIGKAANGKMLRVYEKGKQLGDLASPWVRYEVQLGNRDRVIPFEALTERERFFAGCYPALESMLAFAGETIPTTRQETGTSLAFLLHHLRRCYGKLVHSVLTATDANHTDLIEEVRVIGVPRRVKSSGVVAGVEWADVQARTRRF